MRRLHLTSVQLKYLYRIFFCLKDSRKAVPQNTIHSSSVGTMTIQPILWSQSDLSWSGISKSVSIVVQQQCSAWKDKYVWTFCQVAYCQNLNLDSQQNFLFTSVYRKGHFQSDADDNWSHDISATCLQNLDIILLTPLTVGSQCGTSKGRHVTDLRWTTFKGKKLFKTNIYSLDKWIMSSATSKGKMRQTWTGDSLKGKKT